MTNITDIKPAKERLVTTTSVFTISIIVICLTVLSIWLFGLGKHRTIFINSILSTSILSLSFFLFLTIGLYKGIKLKDNIGKITGRVKIKVPDLSGIDISGGIPDFGDGFGEIILAILFWLFFSVILLILIWFFGSLLWTMTLFFIAMLYWIFFRALRLVFKNSKKCKDNITKSMGYAIGYSTLYIFWIYAIIFISHYLVA